MADLTNWTESLEQARYMHKVLHRAWWEAWRRDNEMRPGTHSAEDVRDATEALRVMKSALARLKVEAIEKYGVKSDCGQCREYSVFGGPGHQPSNSCRSGKQPHCTCDFCF